MDAATLVERCRQGDALAWEAFVRSHQDRVYGLALQYLRNAEEARDTAQDVFVNVYQHLDSFEGGEVLPWLLRVARNACIDRLRRIKSRPPLQDLDIDDGPGLPHQAAGPEEASRSEENRRLVQRAMGLLSQDHREILVLKEIHGLKLEEISSLLRVPVGTLKSRASRARLALADRVREFDPSYGT